MMKIHIVCLFFFLFGNVVYAMTEVESQPNPTSDFVKVKAVKASSFETKKGGGAGDFYPKYTIDGKLEGKSSWRAHVVDQTKGQWIVFELEKVSALKKMHIIFFKGHERKYKFKVEVSKDGEKWTKVHAGESGGASKGFEIFPIQSENVKLIRVTGYGNTNKKFHDWFNIVEAKFSRD